MLAERRQQDPHLRDHAAKWQHDRRSSSDPGRLLLIGDNGDFQKFDVPNLRGISRTAPYFINNSANTLEDVLQQYRAFSLSKTGLRQLLQHQDSESSAPTA
jgi:cytochrome c peroxidase